MVKKKFSAAKTWVVCLGLIALLIMSVSSVSLADTFLAYGPQNYLRAKGKPIGVATSFTAAITDIDYTLRIDNGGQSGEFKRVSSAVIALNGVEIAGPSDFNQNVTVIEKLVTLAANNELVVELRGKPGGGLTIQIIGIDLGYNKPVVNAPADITVTFLDSGGCPTSDPAIQSFLASATAEDEVDGPLSPTNDAPSVFPMGETMVTFTATDSEGYTGSATAKVTVIDQTPPVVVEIGPQGGTIAGAVGSIFEGVRLKFPPGAYESEEIVTIELGDEVKFQEALSQSELGGTVVGPVISITSTNNALQSPAIITLPYNSSALPVGASAENLAIFSLSDDGMLELETGNPEDDYDETTVDLVSGTVSTLLWHFTEVTPVAPDHPIYPLRGGLTNAGCEEGILSRQLISFNIDAQAILPRSFIRNEEGKIIDIIYGLLPRTTISQVVLHSTMSRGKDISKPIGNAYKSPYHAHYYIDRGIDRVVVFPADPTIKVEASGEIVVEQGESVQLIAEPRARVYRLVEENYIANHVKPKDVREASVGIELFQRAERKEVYWAELLDDPPPFTLAQYASVRVLLRGLQERHGLSNGIKLHKEVQPAMPRKECGPGKWRNCGKIDPWRIEDTVELYDDRMESGLILSSALGDIGTCEAPGLPVGAPQDQVQWEACYVTGSCPTSIVTVQDGLVTGIAPGTARIKAQVGGRQGNIIVRVVRPKGPWQMTWTTSENYSSSTSLKLWDYEGWGSETNSSSSGGTALFGENGELLSISTGGSGSTSESHRYYRLCWPYSSGSWWTKLNIDETETQFSFTDNNLRASLNFGVENGKLYVRDPFGWTSFETTGTTKVKLVEWSCNGPQYDTEYETERPYSGKFYGARFGNIMADNETGKSFSSHSEDTYSEPIYWGGAIIGYGTWTETASITIVKTGTGP